METLILICLLLIIVLLLKDKAVINQAAGKEKNLPSGSLKLPSIMGQPKQLKSFLTSNNTTKHQSKKQSAEVGDFEVNNNDEKEGLQILEEDLDNVFNDELDLEEEEKEWLIYGQPTAENTFATGVGFDELSVVSGLMQQDIADPSVVKQSASIVQKIQGTQLLSMLENNVKDASIKIAALLHKSFNEQTNATLLQNKDDEGFDIGEFV
jgi:hypothetical protein